MRCNSETQWSTLQRTLGQNRNELCSRGYFWLLNRQDRITASWVMFKINIQFCHHKYLVANYCHWPALIPPKFSSTSTVHRDEGQGRTQGWSWCLHWASLWGQSSWLQGSIFKKILFQNTSLFVMWVYWERYKVEPDHPEFAARLLQAICSYNAMHFG